MPLDAGQIPKEAIDAELRRRAKTDLRAFISVANPRYRFFDHANRLIDVLERVASGEIKRLLIMMPPRHSKSETASRLFAAYYLNRYPDRWVGITSYAAELAYTLSRAARENFEAVGGTIKDDAAAVKHWETMQGGGFWSAGVGGPITGKGAHLAIIDDPVKNREEADSEVIRKKHKEWFNSTLYSRLEPDAALIVIQTRWHEDDLTGYLLDQEKEAAEALKNPEVDSDAEPEHWHIVCLPAIKEEEAYEYPDTCTVEADPREAGEALCPERYALPALRRIKAKDDRNFEALYQQHPTPKSGDFFHVDLLQGDHIVTAAPVRARRCRGWDKGGTEDAGDYTAGIKIAIDDDGNIFIEDVKRGQWDTSKRDRHIRQTAEADGDRVHQRGEQEPGSGGKESAQNFIKLLAGYPCSTTPSTSAKTLRADPFSSQLNAGNVYLVRGSWNRAFIEELRNFPHGKHDDQVDAVSLAFNFLNQPGPTVSEAEREAFSGISL